MAEASAKSRSSLIARRLVMALALVWIAAAGWHQFFGFSLPYHLRASQLQKQYDRCDGSFSSRYNCKSGIRVSAGRETFFLWTGKFLIVFLPPILLSFGYNAVQRRKWRQEEAKRRKRFAPKPAPRRSAKSDQADAPPSQDAPKPAERVLPLRRGAS